MNFKSRSLKNETTLKSTDVLKITQSAFAIFCAANLSEMYRIFVSRTHKLRLHGCNLGQLRTMSECEESNYCFKKMIEQINFIVGYITYAFGK